MAQVVKKQYVSKAGEWVEVAGGSGGGGDFVPLAGGVDVGPGNLGVVGPTLLTHAARWADGVPRFADEGTRDAAYAAIGGPVTGMRCVVATRNLEEMWDGSAWVRDVYMTYVASGGTVLTSGVQWLPLWDEGASMSGYRSMAQTMGASGGIVLPFTGRFDIYVMVTGSVAAYAIRQGYVRVLNVTQNAQSDAYGLSLVQSGTATVASVAIPYGGTSGDTFSLNLMAESDFGITRVQMTCTGPI